MLRTLKAISTVAIIVIIVAIIVVASFGAYLAFSTQTTTRTATSDQTTTTKSSAGTVNIASWTPPSSLPALTISETGSSLVYPLFNLWVSNFTKTYPSVQINTASTGSGAGQSGAETGTAQIGASDAYLKNSQEAAYPFILNIPLAISAQQINYNVPEVPSTLHLNFSGPVLAGIYNGSITLWDDAQIEAINPGASSFLPHQGIIPIHRADGSGDTFLFTQYLSFTTPSWNSSVGFGTTVSWPSVPAAQSGTGNGGMVQACQQNKYSIAYIGVSYLKQAVGNNLGYAYLKNHDGNYVNITKSNIFSAASVLASQTPADGRISLINSPGANSYPIINYEYAIVSKNQSSSNVALVVRTLLFWVIAPSYGNSPTSFLNQVGFVALPQSIAQLSANEISQIGP